MSVTFLIVDPLQSCVCLIRSDVARFTLLMVLYLERTLHAVLWSHSGTLLHRLAAEPCSTAGLLFPSRCPSGTILLTPYSMVWDWRVSRPGPMLLYWPKLLYPYYSLLFVYRSVLWGFGLWTDRVYITLSQLCTADFFNIKNNRVRSVRLGDSKNTINLKTSPPTTKPFYGRKKQRKY